MATSVPVIDPADYYHAVETLKELLAFRLMVSRDAPDQGMGYSFVQDAIEVMKTAEAKYGVGNGDRYNEQQGSFVAGGGGIS